jgi:hypothetical protein
MYIKISDISELEQAIRSIFNPDWVEDYTDRLKSGWTNASARSERFFYVWTATMAQVHSTNWKEHLDRRQSTLHSKVRTFILDNLSLALIDSSEYVRTWAEYVATAERLK